MKKGIIYLEKQKLFVFFFMWILIFNICMYVKQGIYRWLQIINKVGDWERVEEIQRKGGVKRYLFRKSQSVYREEWSMRGGNKYRFFIFKDFMMKFISFC